MKINRIISIIFLLSISACSDFFSARQQVFECFKTAVDGEPSPKTNQVTRYFHFNNTRLNVSVGAVGIGLAEYNCEKTEFVYQCSDNRKDNLDDQIILDRFTLQAQQTINSTKKTTVINYSCGQLERKVD